MLRWMLRVDSWLDVASLENVEEDHSFFFFFLKKNLMKIFFFLNFEFWKLEFFEGIEIFDFFFFFWKIWKSWIFSRNWKFWLMIFFFFFWKQPKKYEPNAPSPKAFFENFLLFLFLFLFLFFIFFENFGNLEFFHGIEIFDWWFFFFWKI